MMVMFSYRSSDANWAQILRDIDPPSHDLMSGRSRLSMRSSILMSASLRRQAPTHMEQKVMETVFDRVFDMDAHSSSQNSTIGNQFPMGTRLFDNPIAKGTIRHIRERVDTEKLFDEKVESMMNCRSDEELLRWAKTEVFSGPPQSFNILPEAVESSQPKTIHPEIYGRVIAHLMREFRETYNNPHLSIAIFDYTRQRSLISFVTGCTVLSYTELMRTHWSSFHNLQAVLNIAEEMRVNGVQPDDRTKQLYLKIYEEATHQSVWFEGGEEEVMKIIQRLGSLMQNKAGHTKPTIQKRISTR
ncbi:hypothetical protein RHS03_04979, partial [Rhizoctonia solani]